MSMSTGRYLLFSAVKVDENWVEDWSR